MHDILFSLRQTQCGCDTVLVYYLYWCTTCMDCMLHLSGQYKVLRYQQGNWFGLVELVPYNHN